VPVLTRHRVETIRGRQRVEAVVVADLVAGTTRELACDLVVFTGDWRPDHELAREGGLAIDAGTRGPRVDGALRASSPGIFAAGNLVHAAETADVAALSGRHAAHAVRAFLDGRVWPTAPPLAIVTEPPIRWVAPNAVADDVRRVPHGRFLLRVDRFLDAPELEVRQGDAVLWRQRYRRLAPACSVHLDAAWLAQVASQAGPIVIRLRPSRRASV
jgi:hypothetical protein